MKEFDKSLSLEYERLERLYQEKMETSRQLHTRERIIHYFLFVLGILGVITFVITIFTNKPGICAFSIFFTMAICVIDECFVDYQDTSYLVYQDILLFYKRIMRGDIRKAKRKGNTLIYWYAEGGVISKCKVPIQKVELREDIDKDNLIFYENGILYQERWNK